MSSKKAAVKPAGDVQRTWTPKASPARITALRALNVWRQRNETPETIQCDRVKDSRLAERLFYGVLENERFLDSCISRTLTGSRPHPRVMDLLRMSAYQILFLDRVPDSAAVNDAVRICRASEQRFAAGMVNAVLRRICAEKDELLRDTDDPAVRYSHPDWLVRQLMLERDEEFVRRFLQSNQTEPELCLQINTGRTTLTEYLKLLEDRKIEPHLIRTDFPSVRINALRVDTLPGYSEGVFYVQDNAARASVRCAGLRSGMRVLDACAAPGGKSIAAVLEGAEVLACDANHGRMKRCTENFERLRMEIPTRVLDASVFCPEMERAFDAVIADVPCSGSGVIRRHPEIRKRTVEQVKELLALQRSILNNLANYVKPGGMLLYSTCSVLKAEDEEQVEAFLNGHPDYRLSPLALEGFDCSGGTLRSWPQVNGDDGFFAAKLVKNND